MIKKQILEKVAHKLPERASDMKEAILMLIDIIEESSQELIELSTKKLGHKQYDGSKKVIDLLQELDNVREEIVKQVIDVECEELLVAEASDSEAELREKVDYTLYTVDNEAPHDLSEDYRFKRPYAFTWQGEKYYANTFKAILLRLANLLLERYGDDFRKLTDHKQFVGRKKKMISSNPDELLEPRALDDEQTYLYTCLSSDATISLIRKFLEHFEYDLDDFKIYLRADYNALHN